MTVSTTTNSITYTGNGVTTTFAIPYQFISETDLVVTERIIATGEETTQALTTDYTVTGGSGSTGSVEAVAAPASTVLWTITRDTATTQATDYTDNDPFPAETHELGLDRITMIAQDAALKALRSLQFPASDSSTISSEIPNSTARANRLFSFNASGEPSVTAIGELGVETIITPVTVFNGGTGASTASGARSNLAVAGLADQNTFTGENTFTDDIVLSGPFARGDVSELTIATGVITATANAHTVDTEADAATDDLTDIDDANMPANARLTLRANNTGRTVVVKNGSGTHKIHTADGEDFSLDDDEKSIELELRSGEWYEVSRSAEAAATQAEQEAATSTTKKVTPANQQFHPSAAKVWGAFSVAGFLNIGHNVTSVIDNGPGNWAVTIDNNMASANYALVANAEATGNVITGTLNQDAAGFAVQCRLADNNSLTDPASGPISFILMGALA